MAGAQSLSTGSGTLAAPISERGDDFYQTPRPAIDALIAEERLPRCVWEPACGLGAISGPIAEAGHEVISTDLVERGYGQGRIDFLMEPRAPEGVQAIVTNPPFKLAQEFAEKALSFDSVRKVAFLLRLAFLESQRRTAIIDEAPLRRVLLFRKRLPFMHREGYDGPKNSNSGMPFAWFVWDKDDCGPIELRRIDWKEAA